MLIDWFDDYAITFPFRYNPESGGDLFVSSALRVRLSEVASNPLANDQRTRQLGRRLLLRSQHAVSAIEVSDNPNWSGPGVDEAAADAALSIIRRLSLNERNLSVNDDLSDPQGDVVILGGPVSSVFSRLVLGDGRGSPLLHGAHLPFEFDLNESEPPLRGTRPNWRVRRNGSALSFEEDFLLITCLPNPYGIGDERVVNVAGRHAGGTRAIDLVLTNEHIMLDLIARTEGQDGWQALVKVSSDGQRATNIVDAADVLGVTANFGQLRRLHAGKPFMSDLTGVTLHTDSGPRTNTPTRAETSLLGRDAFRAAPAPSKGANNMKDAAPFHIGPRDQNETPQAYARRRAWMVEKLDAATRPRALSREERLSEIQDMMQRVYGSDDENTEE